MPTLTLRFRNRADAHAQLILVREDGSFSVGDIGPQSGYGPAHDLAHYVVESTFGLCEGFLGLVASGWDIKDFEVKGASKLLPPEALFAESAAGQLSNEHMMGQPSTAEEFNWSMGATVSRMGRRDYEPPTIDAERLEAIRARLVELHTEWFTVPPGGTLELEFRSTRRAACARPVPSGR